MSKSAVDKFSGAGVATVGGLRNLRILQPKNSLVSRVNAPSLVCSF